MHADISSHLALRIDRPVSYDVALSKLLQAIDDAHQIATPLCRDLGLCIARVSSPVGPASSPSLLPNASVGHTAGVRGARMLSDRR